MAKKKYDKKPENQTLEANKETFDELVDQVNTEWDKAVEGNKAAGRRVRKTLSTLDKLNKVIRKQTLELVD